MYHGQRHEDAIIEQYFPNGYIGGCIDVGATDGVYINNTLHFEENGWYALCIEPNPQYYNQLERNRNVTLNVAVSDYNEDFGTFTLVNLDGNEEAISALKLDDRLLKAHSHFNIIIRPISCDIRTLDYCIEHYYKYDKIDFLSIDTEGTELDVLKGFDINKWQPRLIMVENNYNDSDIEEYLIQFGYVKDQRIEINDFYIKKMNYYAEFETDKYIKENFFLDFKGTMVEVGAGPSTFYSMSKHFRENGWRCICVEPNPKFVDMHRKEGNEIYQCACSEQDLGEQNFQIADTHLWDKDIEGVSFSSLGIKENMIQTFNDMTKNMTIDNIKTEVVTLNTLLNRINVHNIDFLSVDTEGWEIEVMKGFDINKYNPKVVLLENTDHSLEYINYMNSVGYQLYKNIEYNYIFIKNNF